MDRKELEQIGRLFAHQTVLRMILAEISMTTPDPARWIAKNTQGGGGAIKADHSATKLKFLAVDEGRDAFRVFQVAFFHFLSAGMLLKCRRVTK